MSSHLISTTSRPLLAAAWIGEGRCIVSVYRIDVWMRCVIVFPQCRDVTISWLTGLSSRRSRPTLRHSASRCGGIRKSRAAYVEEGGSTARAGPESRQSGGSTSPVRRRLDPIELGVRSASRHEVFVRADLD